VDQLPRERNGGKHLDNDSSGVAKLDYFHYHLKLKRLPSTFIRGRRGAALPRDSTVTKLRNKKSQNKSNQQPTHKNRAIKARKSTPNESAP
jgi:hypothetical protein